MGYRRFHPCSWLAVQPRFTPTFVKEQLCQERDPADVLSLCCQQTCFCTMEVKHAAAWLSRQRETGGNAVKRSHLPLRSRSRHTGGTGMGSLYLGEVVEINYEYY